MKIIKTQLPGCLEIQPAIIHDYRGKFVKSFHKDWFAENGLKEDVGEVYYSVSRKNVLRGLHFQNPPMDHTKLVYCVQGSVLDVGVDLRVGSPTYGKHFSYELNSVKGNIAYLPSGIAHGFFTLSDEALVVCQMSSIYSPECDAGIRWDSVGIDWPNMVPVLSERDQRMPVLDDFTSPFKFDATLLSERLEK